MILCFAPVFYASLALAQNKIIYMVAPPRSLSTAFMRMMVHHPEFQVISEPSQWVYVHGKEPAIADEWYGSHAPKTVEEIKSIILQKAEVSNVFVKEMSYAVAEHLMQDESFLSLPNIHFVFLTRNLEASIVSLYRKLAPLDLMDYFNEEIVGVRAQHEALERVKKYAKHSPVVVNADELSSDPNLVVPSFCEKVGISFHPEMLVWKPLDQTEKSENWNNNNNSDSTFYWHSEAMLSTGFRSSPHASFSAIENEDHRRKAIEIYNESLPYYRLIQDFQL